MMNDPRGDYPKLEFAPENLDFGVLDMNRMDETAITLVITNSGSGILAGRLYPQVSWVHIHPPDFHFHSGEISEHKISLGENIPQHWEQEKYQNDFLVLINSNGGSASLGCTYVIRQTGAKPAAIRSRQKFPVWVIIPIFLAALLVILIFRILISNIFPKSSPTLTQLALFNQTAATVTAGAEIPGLPTSQTTPTALLSNKPVASTPQLISPSPHPTPTYTPWPRQSFPNPEQIIREYYNALNHQQYDQAWTMLSPGFQDACCNIGGNPPFIIYKGWWNAMEKVEVLSAYLQKWDENPARVYVSLRFHPRKGEPFDAFYVFNVIADANKKRLFIDQVK